MKIITDNEAFVQFNDLGFLQSTDLAIPASIVLKLFENEITIMDDRNRYNFVCFTEAEDIEYFKQLDWMVDYNETKDMSEEELISLIEKTLGEMDSISNAYDLIPTNQGKKRRELAKTFSLLEFKFYSLRNILWYKQGHISLNLPEIESGSIRNLKKNN